MQSEPSPQLSDSDEDHEEQAIEKSQNMRTILVAEDDALVRKLVCRLLTTRGFHVLQADNGKKALELASSFDGEIHMLLSDVVMPGMNGPQVAVKLEKLRPSMKILFMSGFTDNALVFEDDEKVEAHFIPKPFSPGSILSKVQELLDGE